MKPVEAEAEAIRTFDKRYKLLNWPPSRGPQPKGPKVMPAKITTTVLTEPETFIRRNEKLSEFRFDTHIATLSTLTLEQADKLISVTDSTGHCRSIMLDQKDLLPRPKAKCTCLVVGGKRKKFDPPTITVELDYPLDCTVRVTIPPFTKGKRKMQSWGAVLWAIARVYAKIYKNWKAFGVHFHAFDDLWFEGCAVTKDGRMDLYVGS